MGNFASASLYVFCQNEEGEYCILAGKRGSTAPSEPNKYNVPTGMREMGESIEQCAQRECQEETNLNIDKSKIQFVNSEEWGHGKIGANFFTLLDGTTSQHVIGKGDGENKPFEWIPINQISNYQFAFGMDVTINRIYDRFILPLMKTKQMMQKIGNI